MNRVRQKTWRQVARAIYLVAPVWWLAKQDLCSAQDCKEVVKIKDPKLHDI